ncbi:PLP-dependent aminotransferase family protein [Enterovibrio nigricans]|uniref:GntR family transcriptional regulator / MocR family aminotransferase n=1 Tax=Enterovibrio nigricans DSM 22720 TaxID=1121868 RepID=A0A1T4V986_9GAMM|nr:PLP-dependent aminotransferase family protein [Enterovibrio nigricans]PKF49805.1 PLP-dependent aminotransferase family protein [Enterovibrio nigricans]SKA61101.1 GntR family transcriptional regulator / MocR family aminotransferase [Enterovibrio nigricans DSM 22720]
MQPIDVGDLLADSRAPSKQQSLYQAIQSKILQGDWPNQARLPATRTMASELGLSRNTVTAVYDQLKAEGYIDSKPGAGYFVLLHPEHFLHTHNASSKAPLHASDGEPMETTLRRNRPFSPGVPDLAHFPYKKWARLVQIHMQRSILAGQNDIQGSFALREALSEYLLTSRSVDAPPHRIIVTTGAQQALYMALNAILNRGDRVLMENPGYSQMRKALEQSGTVARYFSLAPQFGDDLSLLNGFDGQAIYLTPSNQYPMGHSIDTQARMAIIEWAKASGGWIIEDDYDSEFQFANRPYPSLQGLAAKLHGEAAKLIYVGTFGKAFLSGIRVGYMVVPESLVDSCLQLKDAISGCSPIHIEEVLADFIKHGDYLRHIKKMRHLYQQKHAQFVSSLARVYGGGIEVMSQAAGLHVTFRWQGGPEAIDVKEALADKGFTIRTLDYYCDEKALPTMPRWVNRALVAGIGNSSCDDIEEGLSALNAIFSGE